MDDFISRRLIGPVGIDVPIVIVTPTPAGTQRRGDSPNVAARRDPAKGKLFFAYATEKLEISYLAVHAARLHIERRVAGLVRWRA